MGAPGGCTRMCISARRALRWPRQADCHEFETSLGYLRLFQKRKSNKSNHTFFSCCLGVEGGITWGRGWPPILLPHLSPFHPQERRRAERAEQQRFRTEKERERQAKLAVGV